MTLLVVWHRSSLKNYVNIMIVISTWRSYFSIYSISSSNVVWRMQLCFTKWYSLLHTHTLTFLQKAVDFTRNLEKNPRIPSGHIYYKINMLIFCKCECEWTSYIKPMHTLAKTLYIRRCTVSALCKQAAAITYVKASAGYKNCLYPQFPRVYMYFGYLRQMSYICEKKKTTFKLAKNPC